jgi:hypothetical protein
MIVSKPQEVQLGTDGLIAMTCPFCTAKRVASAEHYCDLHVAIGVECICGQTYDIIIDTHQYYRKNLRLSGAYTVATSRAFRKSFTSRLAPSAAANPHSHSGLVVREGKNNLVRIYEMVY